MLRKLAILFLLPKGRLNRMVYVLCTVSCIIILQLLKTYLNGKCPQDFIYGVMVILLFILAYVATCLSIKRAHDMGRSGYFILWLLVPIINIGAWITLWFVPGDEGANKYGAPLGKIKKQTESTSS
jgi:uncharacterized membrane protein YhaH (DUF805 family)